jgi:hypothetical protein
MNWINRISSMSRDELTEEGNRLIACAQALDNKEKSIKLACQSRSRLMAQDKLNIGSYWSVINDL